MIEYEWLTVECASNLVYSQLNKYRDWELVYLFPVRKAEMVNRGLVKSFDMIFITFRKELPSEAES